MKPLQWTSKFSLARYLLSVEGSCSKIALLITVLYDDSMLPRNDWSVSHTAANRPEFIAQLRDGGNELRRIGFAAHTEHAVEAIRRGADRFNLKFEQITLSSRKASKPDKESP